MAPRNWLITGVSSGFGRELATQLLDRGETVIGTVRRADSVADLIGKYPDTFHRELLDVTDTNAVRDVVEPEEAWGALPDRYRPRTGTDRAGAERVVVGDTELLAVPLSNAEPGGSDPVTRLRDMDSESIDQAVLYPTIGLNSSLLADRAAAYGLRCILEFIPIWGIKDLRMAWQILQIADRPNTALAFDFWHYIRGRRDDGLLRSIPGDRIAYVQVTDAEAEPPPGRSLEQDCLFHRLQPGEGALPIKEMLDILREIGGVERVGPEVFSAKLDALPAEAIAQELREPYWRALAQSGIGRPTH